MQLRKDEPPQTGPCIEPVRNTRALPRGQPGILSNVFGFIGLGCMAALFVIGMFFSDALEDRDMLWLLCALFGGTFLFLGLCAVTQGIPVGWLFTAVGAVTCICSLAYGAADADAREYIVTRTVPMLLLAAFVAAGAALLIIPPRLRRRDEERFCCAVEAVIARRDVREHRSSDGKRRRTCCLTWNYSFHGRQYVWRGNAGRYPEPREVGSTDTLFVDPNHPEECRDPKCALPIAVTSVLGIALIAAGMFGLSVFWNVP